MYFDSIHLLESINELVYKTPGLPECSIRLWIVLYYHNVDPFICQSGSYLFHKNFRLGDQKMTEIECFLFSLIFYASY